MDLPVTLGDASPDTAETGDSHGTVAAADTPDATDTPDAGAVAVEVGLLVLFVALTTALVYVVIGRHLEITFSDVAQVLSSLLHIAM
jgi:Flp pilus assembly pilin Flp